MASDTGDASTGAHGSASGGSTTETGPNPDGDTTSAAAESSGDASTTDTGINPSVIPSLVVEYVDGEGTLQTVQVAQDGSTEIAGAAPLLVFFDATGTRSDTEDTPEAAWWDIGYRLDYGENLGGVWDHGGGSRDEDLGEPVFGRVFTRPGTHVVRLRVRDGVGNESELQLAVATSEPPEPVVIEPDLATWPALTSGSHYQLRAGGDYRGLGELRCGGLHNVLFSKLGEGEDPRIGRFSPEDRGLSSTVLTPARHIRAMDIDIEELHISLIGAQYSGAVRGRVRTFTGDPIGYYYDNAASSEAERENIRYPHGLFLQRLCIRARRLAERRRHRRSDEWSSAVDSQRAPRRGPRRLRHPERRRLHQQRPAGLGRPLSLRDREHPACSFALLETRRPRIGVRRDGDRRPRQPRVMSAGPLTQAMLEGFGA